MTKISEIQDEGTVAALSGVAGVGQFQYAITSKVAKAAEMAQRGPLAPPPGAEVSQPVQPTADQQQQQYEEPAPSQMIINSNQYTGGGAEVMTQGDNFFSRFWMAAKANPVLFAASAVGIVAAVFFVPRWLKSMQATRQMTPVQTMGLNAGPKRRRKKRKSKKTTQA